MKQTITEELNNLYNRDSEKIKNMVKGGVVNEGKYLESRNKVLWLLKEANTSEPFPLVEQIKINIDEKSWQGRIMWKVVGALTYGLQQENYPSFEESYHNIGSQTKEDDL